ncbi:MATE family efflux transporter [Tumebacillus permanentifrigoris]|uniref:Probable multidrug resistance protein NorM n=1 Tax=Tumebacillus permanentifrigoris TaxID=378543 RepID=A0A316DBR6_9BACL|nr:MATE family efflux transporter [Tumebacillus permanentifrigoris]PWK15016.1 putative MATE family efflux protein [Tumebacillus permanentifrigoris]
MERKLVAAKNLFTNGDLFHLFLPLIIEQFLEYLVGLADSIMVAYVGESAVSGVSLVDFVMALLISLFAALATGGAVIAGQYVGRKQMDESREAVTQLVWLVGAVSIGIMVIIYLIKPFILNGLFGQISDEVRRDADTYLMITALSIPFLALYNAGAAIFRTIGNSKLPMQIMLAMNIAHALGNAILIYGFHFGVSGVAIPTLLSRIAAGVLIIALALNQNRELYIRKSFTHNFNWPMIKKVLGIGVPYGLENGLFYLGRILVLSLVATFGTAAIAANAVSGTIVMFEVLPGMAIGLGLTVIISRCVGAEDYEQVKQYTKKIMGIVYVANLLSCAVVLALLPTILHVYGLSEAATALTKQIVWWHAVGTVLIWPLSYTLPVTFRAAGDAKFPMMVGILSMFFCRIALAYLLGVYFNMGMFGTWVAMFIDWIVKAILFVWRYSSGKWTRVKAI